ncbi:MAG: hypothetical protein ACRC20_16715 [Segniliparus sp.]|uniref:Rv0361 family membrane protein n=1 Tax=Segniliparus sp. TaxID=2804064 RepID=UPI003F409BDD
MTYPQQPPFSQPYGPPPNFPPQHGAQPPKKKRTVLWIVLSVVGALLLCGGGFALFIWKMALSPDSGPQQVKSVAKDYKRAEDANDAAALAGLLCSADSAQAEAVLRGDAKVARGDIDVKSSATINDLGMAAFTDAKGAAWTLYFHKEDGKWKVCPSSRDAFKAANTTTNERDGE